MAVTKKLKHVDGLKELDDMLDALIDPKFRARALRNAAKKTMAPVEEVLKAKLPDGGENESSYKHYADGYQSGDLKKGVVTKVTVNTDKKIAFDKKGYIKGGRHNELNAAVTFKPKLVKLAAILEHGRSKRDVSTRDGKVFYFFGNATDKTTRDIGSTAPRNFISETATQCEAMMVSTFKDELLTSIEAEAKKMQRKANAKPRKRKNAGN